MINGITAVAAHNDCALVRVQPVPCVGIDRVKLFVCKEALATGADVGDLRDQLAWQFTLNVQVPLVSARIAKIVRDRLNRIERVGGRGDCRNGF